ncbi:hypothetical protein TVAG_252630 [Trichomonas vaginalis G3]|uniref:Uncharacterized protein n=1 Tax=Trichomonas vaginalis (strain ATCC PRA-98 / G3) TaxID=412133 RepID=A2DW05_TRIV3|nr:armadillo (ARM) repeat-containing protein family [Trichomonas vaginalis G3]EAY15450.1 hypothetical protein TVAG_252630 [Trichomonas vaginalis G3]KAI5499565.1 armadillo (ARM) repeat-containing protein family [Trichomonas vaginalis G3]|eukprot:XP_001327673.1 hypothetical protein [Trichomonas vaginalis G3]
MDDEYKDFQQIAIDKLIDPLDQLSVEQTENSQDGEELKSFTEEFLKNFETFMNEPSFFTLIDLNDKIRSNQGYQYANIFKKDYIQNVISLFSPTMSNDDANALLDNFILLLEMKNSPFVIRFSDNGIIAVLQQMWDIFKDKQPQILDCFSFLISQTHSEYADEILHFIFKTTISNIIKAKDIAMTHASMTFILSMVKNLSLTEKQKEKIKNATLAALNYDDRSVLLSLWCISYFLTNYIQDFKLLGGTTLAFSILTLIPHEDDNITLISLEIFRKLLGRPDTHFYTFPYPQVFEKLIDLTNHISEQVTIKAFTAINAAIKHYPGAPEHFLMLGIMDHLSEYMETATSSIKEISFVIFSQLLNFTIPEASRDMLLDPRLEMFTDFVFDTGGRRFVLFVNALLTALHKCDSASIGTEPRERIAQMNIVQNIDEIYNSLSDEGSKLADLFLSEFETNE